jgi:hypothetical protein
MRNRRASNIPWSRPLADLVRPAIDPVFVRRGFGQTNLVLYWDDIVGERLAGMSQPVKVQWPVRPSETAADYGGPQAALIIRAESGFALELQHLAPIIIERVNAHFGWRCISRLVLTQGPVAARLATRPMPRPIDKAAEIAAEQIVDSGAGEPLRQALVRLGARILAGP